MPRIDLGQATIRSRSAAVAGAFTTRTLTYTAGHPIDDTGFVKIVMRFASDCGTPQFAEPAAPNYTTVTTTGDCRIEPRWDPKGHTRPWGRALFLKVMGGFLDRGRKIVVVFGDRSQRSPGWLMQTFCEGRFELKTFVDPIASYQFKELATSPTFAIKPGKPTRAVCIAPSHVVAGKKFTYRLKLEDRWGNPTGRRVRQLTHAGFARPGTRVITARDAASGLSARSNPIGVVAEPPQRHHWWADFHGQSAETIGTNTIDDYFRFARDQACLDIAAHQGNDFQITDKFWAKINRVTRAFYDPGSFVTFPGYEWSGNTPLGGDRNVFYTSEGGRIARSSHELLPDEESRYTIAPTAAHLFKHLRRCKRPRAFVVPHVGGRYSDLRWHDPTLEFAVEVHSAWGTFEWLVDEALQRGYRVGICANSDGHKGRPGASYPGASKFGSYGGLTCVLAPRLDRASIVRALEARHFYATTGHRSIVDVHLTTADGRTAIMGDQIDVTDEAVWLEGRIVGTGAIENVVVRHGVKTLKILRPYTKKNLGRRIKVAWSGAEVRGRDRLVAWDGGLTLRGNAIVRTMPINFWNPNRPLRRAGKNRLEWHSVTTGGTSGVILTLRDDHRGSVQIETLQRRAGCALQTLGLTGRTWAWDGLDKKIEVTRLPTRPSPREFSFRIALSHLPAGVNPIYIRVTQEDGHRAWTSPIYVRKQ